MKWAERVRVKSNQSTMYEGGAGANARVLMMEAAAADVLGVISDGTEVWDGIWREGSDTLLGGVSGLGGSKKSASERIMAS